MGGGFKGREDQKFLFFWKEVGKLVRTYEKRTLLFPLYDMRKRVLMMAIACSLCGLGLAQEPAEVGAALQAVELKNHPFMDARFYPEWSKMTAEQGAKDVLLGIELARKRLEIICSVKPEQATYENVFGALENADREMDRALGFLYHLSSVMDSPEIRKAKDVVLPACAEFSSSITANDRLWSVIKSASQQPWVKTLDPERQRYIQQVVDSFTDSGADLPADKKERKAEIIRELSQLANQFNKNVLDSTNEWEWVVTDKSLLDGLTEQWFESARKAALEKGYCTEQEPQWLVTLDYSCYRPVVELCHVESTRRKCWEAFANIAKGGKYDNEAIVARVMELRGELAGLLGFDHFVDMQIAHRMVDKGDKAMAFVDGMMQKIKPAFDRENAEFLAYVSKCMGKPVDKIDPWSRMYYGSKMAKELFSFDPESLRPYLACHHVLKGMFSIAQHLYGVTLKEVPTACVKPGEVCPAGKVEVWHPEVRLFEVYDSKTQAHLGSFYLDLYPRASKRAGAWVMGMSAGEPAADGKPHTPHLATLVCNLTPPHDGGVALYSHMDVETLFHEFGHMLHVMCSDAGLRVHMGTSVAWDFVELPSQLNENWTWEPAGLAAFAFHYKTGEPMPKSMVESMQKARFFMPANDNMGQLSIAKLDLEMHMNYESKFKGKPLDDATNELLAPWRMPFSVEIPSIMRTLTHCISGGYAGGYYSYKWAEVLAADAFSRFAKEGVMNENTGADYRKHILAPGDSRPAADLYREFMGRDPNPDALLRKQGLLPQEG